MLEERDLDVLSAMMTIFLHAAEQCVSMVELHYQNQNRKSQEYNQLVKARGKAYAEQVLGKLVRDCFRHDKKWDFNELMRLGTAFKRQMDRLTDVSVHKSVSKDATEEEKAEAAMATMRMFDDQRHYVAQLLYVASMMFNLDETAALKHISTLKLLTKNGTIINQSLIDRFEEGLR